MRRIDIGGRRTGLITAIVGIAALMYGCSSPQLRSPTASSPYFDQPVPDDTPRVFAPGVVSTGAVELNGVFSPDLREFFFARMIAGVQTLHHSVLENGMWSAPRALYLFPGGTPGVADDMAFSPDGQRLYFLGLHPHPDDPAPRGPDIWVSERVNGKWSTATVVPSPVSTPESGEVYPVVVADGSLYFISSRPGGIGPADLYRAQRLKDGTFAPPVNVGEPINSEHGTGDTYVSPDEQLMVFASRRPPTRGSGGDLFVAFRNRDGTWGTPVHLGDSINTTVTDYCPMITPDGKYLFFSRRNGSFAAATEADVYWVDARVIERLRPQSARIR